MKFTRKQERVFIFSTLGVLLLAGGIFWYRTMFSIGDVVAPLVSAGAPEPVYELVSKECDGGIRGECLWLTTSAWDGTATTTTVLADDIADRYVSAGGKARRLELGYVNQEDEQYFFEEVYASQQSRFLYRLDQKDSSWTKLSGWRHDPFAGDRSAPGGRYYSRVTADGREVELFDVMSLATTTPLKLTSDEETLWATDCGNQGPEPRLHWQNDTTLTVDVFAVGKKAGKVCAGPFLRSVTLVVE